MDPTHPLFGRRFRLISAGSSGRENFVRVEYQFGLDLRIPHEVTNLYLQKPVNNLHSKISLNALKDLVAMIDDREGAWRSSLKTSGAACQQRCATTSPKTSPRSCGS
jgi:hypothetical protein